MPAAPESRRRGSCNNCMRLKRAAPPGHDSPNPSGSGVCANKRQARSSPPIVGAVQESAALRVSRASRRGLDKTPFHQRPAVFVSRTARECADLSPEQRCWRPSMPAFPKPGQSIVCKVSVQRSTAEKKQQSNVGLSHYQKKRGAGQPVQSLSRQDAKKDGAKQN